MSCNPCAITVNPQKVGLVVDYLAGGARPEYKAGGFVVRPQNIGMIIAACKIPATGPSEIIIEPVNTVGITVEDGSPDITIDINQELDPACDWETGVTITVDGVPVNILSVTPDGDSDPWGYIYEVDVTLNSGEAIVWDYDSAVGDICALSGTKLTDSTETTTVPIDPLGTGSYIWLNPTTIIKSVTGFVADWDKDSSSSYTGNANLSQFSNLIPESTVNGLDVCRSANTSPRYLINDDPTPITSGFTIYVAGGFDAIVNDPAFIVSGISPNEVAFENTGGLLQIRGSSVGVLTSMAEDTNTHVWAARIDGSNYRSRISGDPSGWVTSASATTQDLDYLTVLNFTNVAASQAVGWAGEVIISTNPDSDAKMDAWYSELLTKWGL